MLLPKRIWKDIQGFEGLYQVSNDGKVRSLDRIINYKDGRARLEKGHKLKPHADKKGYTRVTLCKNNKCKPYLVHRLVAMAFIPNPNNWPQVNHKDENKTNNTVWNLEWCDRIYNCNYGTRNERISNGNKEENHWTYNKPFTEEHKRKLSENHADVKGKNNPAAKPVLMFTKDGEFIRRFDCVRHAYEYLGKNRHNSNINKCARGEQEIAYGFKWKYEKTNNYH